MTKPVASLHESVKHRQVYDAICNDEKGETKLDPFETWCALVSMRAH